MQVRSRARERGGIGVIRFVELANADVWLFVVYAMGFSASMPVCALKSIGEELENDEKKTAYGEAGPDWRGAGQEIASGRA